MESRLRGTNRELTERDRTRECLKYKSEEPKLQSLSQPLVKTFHNSGGCHPAFFPLPPITGTWKLTEGNGLHFHEVGSRQRYSVEMRLSGSNNSICNDTSNLGVMDGKLRG